MGCDNNNTAAIDKYLVSIHAPAWGATNNLNNYNNGKDVSIHAPAWGATAKLPPICRPKKVSIHAPAWGATIYS